MAIFLRGMSPAETAALTDAMMRSGVVADLSASGRPRPTSTRPAGVGDKVSLHLAPMVAACGVVVPMISGRGLGPHGRYASTSSSPYPGFRMGLSIAEYAPQVARIGLVAHLPDRRARPRGPQALRAARRDGHGRVHPAHLRQHPEQEARRGDRRPGPRREVRERGLHEGQGQGAGARGRPDGRGQGHGQARARRDDGDGGAARARRRQRRSRSPSRSSACRGSGARDLMEVTFALGEQMLVLAGADEGRPAAPAPAGARASPPGPRSAKFRELLEPPRAAIRASWTSPARLPQARSRMPLPSPRRGLRADGRRHGGRARRAAARAPAGRGLRTASTTPWASTDLVKVGEPRAGGRPRSAAIHAQRRPGRARRRRGDAPRGHRGRGRAAAACHARGRGHRLARPAPVAGRSARPRPSPRRQSPR